jgi:predicted RNase H-like HicB family nuclease
MFIMENLYSIHLKIPRVENGQFLAESDDIPGLVAQGRTIPEAVEIAQDVARKLIESYVEHGDPIPASLKQVSDRIELDVAVGV